MDIREHSPQLNILANVRDSKICIELDLTNPGIICQGLPNNLLVPLGCSKNKRSNIQWSLAVQPRGVPKWCIGTVANGDCCACVEELHVNVVTRIPGANPHLGVVSPL